MSDPTKYIFFRWLPLLVSLLTNAVLFGIFYGSTKTEMSSLRENTAALRTEMMPMEKRLQVFGSTAEQRARQESIDRELREIKQLIRELAQTTNARLDALSRR
mgnify:CR=1 FL=1